MAVSKTFQPAKREVWRGKPTPEIRLAVYRKSNFACARCGLEFDAPEDYDGRYALYMDGYYCLRRHRWVTWILEIDHITPYSRGGVYEVRNLQALCTACNARKGDRA